MQLANQHGSRPDPSSPVVKGWHIDETTDKATVIENEIRVSSEISTGGIKSRTIDNEDIEPSPSKSHRPPESS